MIDPLKTLEKLEEYRREVHEFKPRSLEDRIDSRVKKLHEVMDYMTPEERKDDIIFRGQLRGAILKLF